MQDRYAGDIGDYGKFAILRALAAEGFSIGINWYRAETLRQEQSVDDGKKLIPDKLAACDPMLADALRRISVSDDRSILLLEEANLVPGARYWSPTVPVEGRTGWHKGALGRLANSDLVFLDPDNGLLVKSVGKRSIRSPKYTFYEEVADYIARGQSVIVYNHRSRKKAEVYFGEICERLAADVPQAYDVAAITFPRGSVRDYFAISASAEHSAAIRSAFVGLVGGVWGRAGMCHLQILTHSTASADATRTRLTRSDKVTASSTTTSTAPTTPKIIGFWKENEYLGCCSNWHHSGFDFGGVRFATGEHWMMWQKARVMGDEAMAAQILQAPDSRKAKELGAKVSPYDGKLWDAVREQLVYYGVREKFLQNYPERSQLLATGSAILAEASPYDNVWGVGMSAEDPNFKDPKRWRGSNLLGRVCMRVRSDLRQPEVVALHDDNAIHSLLYSSVGGMTLLQLSRHPNARTAVHTYARIARHLSGTHATLDGWMEKVQMPIRDIAGCIGKRNGLLTEVAWKETLVELAFLYNTGML